MIFSVDMLYTKVVDNFHILLVLEFHDFRSAGLGVMHFAISLSGFACALYRSIGLGYYQLVIHRLQFVLRSAQLLTRVSTPDSSPHSRSTTAAGADRKRGAAPPATTPQQPPAFRGQATLSPPTSSRSPSYLLFSFSSSFLRETLA